MYRLLLRMTGRREDAEDLYQAWQSPYAPGGLETLETAVAGWLRELA